MIFQCLQHQTRSTILKHSSSSQGKGERKAKVLRNSLTDVRDSMTIMGVTTILKIMTEEPGLRRNLIALRMNSNRLPSPEFLMLKEVLPAFLTLLFSVILSIVLYVPQICQELPHFKNVDLDAPYASKYPRTTFSSRG